MTVARDLRDSSVTDAVSTTPSTGRCAARCAAETLPRLVPISHTGTAARRRRNSTTAPMSVRWAEESRKSRRPGPRRRSLGTSTTTVRNPCSANIRRVRTRKLLPYWVGSSFHSLILPEPPGNRITDATGGTSGSMSRNNCLTSGRVIRAVSFSSIANEGAMNSINTSIVMNIAPMRFRNMFTVSDATVPRQIPPSYGRKLRPCMLAIYAIRFPNALFVFDIHFKKKR